MNGGDDVLRVAVIGLGGIGRTHARYYQENPRTELVALCDKLVERVEPEATHYGVPAYTDVTQLLADNAVDAVSVATAGPENGGHHFEPAMQAVEAGIHVLVEKPLSNDTRQARELVERAKDRGVLLGVNLNHRFTPVAERAKALQSQGKLGNVLFVNMSLWIDNPNEDSPWLHMRALHPHSFDVMQFFGGPIKRVQAFMHKGPGRSVWSNTSVNVQFATGAIGHLTGSYDASKHHPIERCEVGGSNGRFVIENVFERLEFYPRDSPDRTVVHNPIIGGTDGFDHTFRNRIYTFIDQVLAGGPLDASGEDGLAAQQIIEAAIRSFEEDRIVDVPQEECPNTR